MTSDPRTRQKILLPEFAAYIFDIDGTLLVMRDRVHWSALRQAMREAYGIDQTIDGLPYHGKTDISILRATVQRAGVADDEFERGLARALEVVCREVALHCQDLVPSIPEGILPLLESLRHREKLVGVASGNLESVGWQKIQSAGLRGFFAFGAFGDRSERRVEIFRHALEQVDERLGPQARTCFLGDTPADIESARALGAGIIAVSTGSFSFDALRASSPDLCVANCREFFPD